MENPIKMDDLGVPLNFWKHPNIIYWKPTVSKLESSVTASWCPLPWSCLTAAAWKQGDPYFLHTWVHFIRPSCKLQRSCYVVCIYIYIWVVSRTCLPFISSSPTPPITTNSSTTAPQHMLPTHQMSCPITFPNLTLTHFAFNFPLTIFLIIHLFLLLMFIPVLLIHDPNFLRIFSSPAFPIPQANIACSIFSPVQFKHSPASTVSTLFLLNFFDSLFILTMLPSPQMLCPTPIS